MEIISEKSNIDLSKYRFVCSRCKGIFYPDRNNIIIKDNITYIKIPDICPYCGLDEFYLNNYYYFI